MSSKYGKYILREPLGILPLKEVQTASIIIGHHGYPEGWEGLRFNMAMHSIYMPFTIEKNGHVHDEDEILVFAGNNPMDFRDFGAEACLTLGEEGEKHIINSTTVVYIPKGLVHCPLEFTRVDKPILFASIVLDPAGYKRDERHDIV